MATIGVLGRSWRATVTVAGTIEPWGGSAALHWYVAADDRWHIPEHEPTVRQRRIGGTPVVETRLKVPRGDVVHRAWCVADGGGVTVVEIDNESPLPVAVAFDRGDLLTQRPASGVAVQGIDLPPDSVVFPVGHHSALRVGLRHDRTTTAVALDRLAPAEQVARGWTSVIERGGRLVLPDEALLDDLAARRSELALCGPCDPADDAERFLCEVGQLVLMGERADPWVPDVAAAVGRIARGEHTWPRAAALDAAAIVLHRAIERRGLVDLSRLRSPGPDLPATAPKWLELPWHLARLARPFGNGTVELLGRGIPEAWLGSSIEVHDQAVGPDTSVSFALRWHGARPAVLWEVAGSPVTLAAPAMAPAWSSNSPRARPFGQRRHGRCRAAR